MMGSIEPRFQEISKVEKTHSVSHLSILRRRIMKRLEKISFLYFINIDEYAYHLKKYYLSKPSNTLLRTGSLQRLLYIKWT